MPTLLHKLAGLARRRHLPGAVPAARAERRRLECGERRALNRLRAQAGPAAAQLMTVALSAAESYRPWDDWSLAREAIIWAVELICREAVTQVAEFGAGYSTVALSSFIASQGLQTRLDAFEHQPRFAQALLPFTAAASSVRLHCVPLLQIDDQAFEAAFDVAEPRGYFRKHATPVPPELWDETRVTNAFYDLSSVSWPARSVDLVLLDGPNGNGRSLAFPFLRHALRAPGWVIVDDYNDYPFLDYLNRVFLSRLVRQADYGRNRYVLVQVTGVRGER